MTDFTVADGVTQHIAETATPHFMMLNVDITAAYPERPDRAYTLAIGFGVAALLNSLRNPGQKESAVDGINIMTKYTGYALTPVT